MSRKRRCYSGIGGQAVLEGIMMKNNTRYSVAVRKPDGEIDVEIGEYTGILGESGITKLPFIRGIFSFVDSLILGTKCLNHSAAFYEEEEETAADKMVNKAFKGKAESVLMTLTMVIAVLAAVGLFMVLPYLISNYLERFVRNDSLLAIMEGVIRILIFVAYVLLISLMKDIRRVYMYHGAEHKCINCLEKGRELTVENVMRSSKQHRRCGTSFLLFVMLVSVVLFFFIRVDNMALQRLIRILLIPVIAGIAYEIIRLAGRSDNWLVRMISAPGLWLQGLTTKEPDESMVEVAIKAVEAVFDWRAWLQENFGYEADGDETAEDEEPGETVENPEEMTGEDLSDEDQREAEEEQYEDWEEADREAEEEQYEDWEEADREAEEEQYGEWEEADREAEEAECEDWEEAEEEAYENSGKMSAQPRQGENRRQSRQPAEELWGEDEDEPSFIGNDEIE